MSRSNISIIPGDRVKVEINQYDMNQWRIVFRYNNYQQQQQQPFIWPTQH
jgi:translation initiation factor IF-1